LVDQKKARRRSMHSEKECKKIGHNSPMKKRQDEVRESKRSWYRETCSY
jgi:hypothetical protein